MNRRKKRDPVFRFHPDYDPAVQRTASRREIKYALRETDFAAIWRILSVNCTRIVYGRDPSTVNSIYYDDCSLSACRESIDGVAKRGKVRLRWYDDGNEDGRFFFEVKRRTGLVVDKWRAPIQSTVPLQSLSFSEIRGELSRILPPAERELLFARPEPVLMTRYRREHFVAVGSPVRITLDSDITCYDQSAAPRMNLRFGVSIPDLLVIEGKVPPGNELELPGFLHPLEPRITKSSKYVLGCRILGLATTTLIGHE